MASTRTMSAAASQRRQCVSRAIRVPDRSGNPSASAGAGFIAAPRSAWAGPPHLHPGPICRERLVRAVGDHGGELFRHRLAQGYIVLAEHDALIPLGEGV